MRSVISTKMYRRLNFCSAVHTPPSVPRYIPMGRYKDLARATSEIVEKFGTKIDLDFEIGFLLQIKR